MTYTMSKTLPKVLIAGLLGTTLLSTAHAQPVAFETVDIDGDGMLTIRELETMLPDLTEDQIALADADGNGMLDPTEYSLLMAE